MRGHNLAAAVVVLAMGAGAATASAGAVVRGRVALAPCRLSGVEREALCGTVTVPERRDRAGGRTIDLRLAVLPARAATPQPDPLFVIAGGPGQSAVNIADREAVEHAATLAEREIVLLDQRGSGGSNRLDCRQYDDTDMRRYLSGGFNLDALRRCRRELEARADLTAYTTDAAVADLEDVRQAMGYDHIDLDGGSYGTRVVLWYLKRHGDRVRVAVLRGVSPTDYALPLPFARAGQEALDRLFADCDGDAACARAFPHLRREFNVALTRIST
ncbi:MAG TPA: alpha/beta fold hydrolase, partial [Planctomycetota bacterium]|nr:alpha/beta fold hydrolase [Planctomycetota bacterium]